MRKFIHVKTGGSHREMGVDFGRAARDIILSFRDDSREFYRKHTKQGAAFVRDYAMRNYLPFVRRRYPQYLEEVRGIAEGAHVPFEDMFYLTADEELQDSFESGKEKCSSAAVASRRGMFVLHNEDYPPRYYGRLIVVEAEPDDAPAFLSLTYPYVIAGSSCGMNAAGLAFTVDSINYRPSKRGMPVSYVLRDMYAARNIGQVGRKIAEPDKLSCFAVTVASDVLHTAINWEVTFKKIVKMKMGRSALLAHTNHVISSQIDKRGELPKFGSRIRLAALEELLLRGAPIANLKRLQAVLSSENHGLLRVTRKPTEYATIASVVLDVRHRVMYVSKRGPKGHDFMPYKLGR